MFQHFLRMIKRMIYFDLSDRQYNHNFYINRCYCYFCLNNNHKTKEIVSTK